MIARLERRPKTAAEESILSPQVLNGAVLLFLGPLKFGRNTADEDEVKEIHDGDDDDEEEKVEQEYKTGRILNHTALSMSFFIMFVDTIKMVFISDTTFDDDRYYNDL